MQDRELVAAITAGDPEGLAEAIDRYAVPLYAYCRLMRPDPDSADGAAQAVQDTFVIAASRLQALRDPDRLGPWLHAVARNECLRHLAAQERQGAARLGAPADPGDARPAVELPYGLREQIGKVCADSTPAGRAYRVSVTHRAGPFDRTGFPKPIIPPGPAWWHEVRRHPRAAAVAVVAGAVLAAGITALAVGGGSHRAHTSTVALGGGISPVGSSTAPDSTSAPASPGHRTAAAKGTPTPSVLADTPAGQGTTPGTPRPSTPAPSSSRSSSSPSPSRSPFPSPSSSPAQGHLAAVPTKLVLSAVTGQAAKGTFTLTAVGGPVRAYAITSASSKVTVSPYYGSLLAGARVVITVTVKSLVALDTKITVLPSYLVITVVFSIKV